jgi:hypothetical protein
MRSTIWFCALIFACSPSSTSPDASTTDADIADQTSNADVESGPLPPITLHPTNILNNGGFEDGLMCYGQYEWAPNPSNVGTGYAFSLSTSAHTGTYALQMTCTDTSQCGYPAKAAVEANGFSTPTNQTYNVTIWSNCEAGDTGFFYTPTVTSGSFTSPFACTGAWAQNTFSFTTDATSDSVYYALYYDGTKTLLLDDMVITLGDGTVPEQTIKHPGDRNAKISGTTYELDGAPFVPLGFYGIPESALAQAKTAGANAAAWGDPGCYNTSAERFADAAYEAGIAVIAESSTTARAAVPAVFSQVMMDFGHHLSEIAWYLDDEPDLPGSAVVYEPITPAMLTSEYAAVHAASTLPIAVMLQQAHYSPPSVDQPYAPAMDVYMSEPYGASLSGVTQTNTVFATMTPRPIWLAMDDAGTGLIVPKAYYGFTEGATGLFFFTWDGFVTDGTLAEATQALTELSTLSNVITSPPVTGVTAPNGISFIARSSGGKTTIIAVNPSASNVSGAFSYAPLTAGQTVTVQFESRTITATAGSFTDTFTGVSRHVYVM